MAREVGSRLRVLSPASITSEQKLFAHDLRIPKPR